VSTVIALAYLLAAVLFILGLKQLSSPRHARRGNLTAAMGMLIALVATVLLIGPHITTPGLIVIMVGIAVGTAVGALSARSVKMTAMPQMVAIFNGVGGGAAALVAVSELMHQGTHPTFALAFPSVFSIVIGSIS
jgi:NAD(P) transhydrogenase subunit beta